MDIQNKRIILNNERAVKWIEVSNALQCIRNKDKNNKKQKEVHSIQKSISLSTLFNNEFTKSIISDEFKEVNKYLKSINKPIVIGKHNSKTQICFKNKQARTKDFPSPTLVPNHSNTHPQNKSPKASNIIDKEAFPTLKENAISDNSELLNIDLWNISASKVSMEAKRCHSSFILKFSDYSKSKNNKEEKTHKEEDGSIGDVASTNASTKCYPFYTIINNNNSKENVDINQDKKWLNASYRTDKFTSPVLKKRNKEYLINRAVAAVMDLSNHNDLKKKLFGATRKCLLQKSNFTKQYKRNDNKVITRTSADIIAVKETLKNISQAKVFDNKTSKVNTTKEVLNNQAVFTLIDSSSDKRDISSEKTRKFMLPESKNARQYIGNVNTKSTNFTVQYGNRPVTETLYNNSKWSKIFDDENSNEEVLSVQDIDTSGMSDINAVEVELFRNLKYLQSDNINSEKQEQIERLSDMDQDVLETKINYLNCSQECSRINSKPQIPFNYNNKIKKENTLFKQGNTNGDEYKYNTTISSKLRKEAVIEMLYKNLKYEPFSNDTTKSDKSVSLILKNVDWDILNNSFTAIMSCSGKDTSNKNICKQYYRNRYSKMSMSKPTSAMAVMSYSGNNTNIENTLYDKQITNMLQNSNCSKQHRNKRENSVIKLSSKCDNMKVKKPLFRTTAYSSERPKTDSATFLKSSIKGNSNGKAKVAMSYSGKSNNIPNKLTRKWPKTLLPNEKTPSASKYDYGTSLEQFYENLEFKSTSNDEKVNSNTYIEHHVKRQLSRQLEINENENFEFKANKRGMNLQANKLKSRQVENSQNIELDEIRSEAISSDNLKKKRMNRECKLLTVLQNHFAHGLEKLGILLPTKVSKYDRSKTKQYEMSKSAYNKCV